MAVTRIATGFSGARCALMCFVHRTLRLFGFAASVQLCLAGCLSRDSKPSAWNDWPGCKHDGVGDQWWNEETVAWQQREWGLDAGSLTTVPEIVMEPPWTSSLTQCARLNQYLPCFGKPSTLFSVCVPMYSIDFYHLKRCNTFLLVDIYLWLGFRQSSWAEKNSRSFRIDLLMLTVCTCGCQHEAGFMRDWIQRNFQSQTVSVVKVLF